MLLPARAFAAMALLASVSVSGCAEDRGSNSDLLGGDPEGVRSEDVRYYGEVEGLLARPEDEEPRAGVIMIHEWWGLTDNVRAMAKTLASEGYAVLAVDLFHGSVATTSDEARAQVQTLDESDALLNLRAAAAHLRDEVGVNALVSLGWCFGGGQSLQLALSGEQLAATVIYYGQLVTDEDRLAAIDWPVLGIFGADDASIPVAEVERFDGALTNLSIEHEVHIYDGVGHAFANPTGENYAPEETEDAWERTLAFLEAATEAEPSP